MLSARVFWQNARRRIASPAQFYTSAPRPQRNLNAFITQDESPTNGKTVAIKDNIITACSPTTAASTILNGYIAPYDATVVKTLRDNGFVIARKTNLDEFGMGSHNQHSAAGPALNLYSRNGEAVSPGGSSGGSAIAVASGECWAALGTDTGGSVRLPAAYTGVVGFKPSYGRLSRWGVIQYANSLDTVGILAQQVDNARQIFRCLDHYDAMDPTSQPQSVRERSRSAERTTEKSLKIGIPVEYNISELSPAVRSSYLDLLDRLQAAGHTLHTVSLPSTQQALSAYYVLAPAEASSNLAKYDGVRYGRRTSGPDALPKDNLTLYAQTRSEGFGEEVKRRVLLGAYTLSSEAMDNYFIQAQKVRRLVQRDFDQVFSQANPLIEAVEKSTMRGSRVDILLTPTVPTLPPTIEEVKNQTPVESYMNDVFTVPASLAGLPAISIPMPLNAETRQNMDSEDVRSVGMQVIAQFGDDELVLEAAEEMSRLMI
ncbi:Hypothetical protein R9X50_00207500 [Acrodontium crateriforme]|uniref:Glutamyl-tRNA(Gln) amidotransferase subunit A, mitochondrial n=1 Tax=Acrodontium crateriforme TaxID=150365 RepID=A0AAQ3R8P5_9PEZI|nr:Hypothetical protein R9X50_00207500 [Acrodontium crateriforme]